MSALAGRRIVVTRAPHQAAELDSRLRERGAEPVPYPCIQIAPPDDCAALDAALRGASRGEYDWLVLTSANTVTILKGRLDDLGLSLPAALKVASVGPATAHSAQALLGLTARLIPEKFVAEALAEALAPEQGTRILLPQADKARPVLAQSLIASGAAVRAVEAYRTIPGSGGAEVPRLLPRKEIDAITFASASAARNFAVRLVDEGGSLDDCDGVCIACIGPVTAEAVREIGLQADVQPGTHTLDGLIDGLEDYFHLRRADHG